MNLTYDIASLTQEEAMEQLYGGIQIKDLRRVITNTKKVNFGVQAQLVAKPTLIPQLVPSDRPEHKVNMSRLRKVCYLLYQLDKRITLFKRTRKPFRRKFWRVFHQQS